GGGRRAGGGGRLHPRAGEEPHDPRSPVHGPRPRPVRLVVSRRDVFGIVWRVSLNTTAICPSGDAPMTSRSHVLNRRSLIGGVTATMLASTVVRPLGVAAQNATPAGATPAAQPASGGLA